MQGCSEKIDKTDLKALACIFTELNPGDVIIEAQLHKYLPSLRHKAQLSPEQLQRLSSTAAFSLNITQPNGIK